MGLKLGETGSEYRARMLRESQAQATKMAPKVAADAAKQQAESTGELFDPRTDPRTATVYNADGSKGGIDTNTQLQSRRNQVTNRAMNAYGTADSNTATSRANADASAQGKPTYQAMPAYQTPTYQAPPDYQAPDPYTYGKTRPELESDDQIAQRYGQYQSLIGNDPSGSFDYQPQQVGDYGQAFQTWLGGAQNQFADSLKRQATSLNESAAGRGRLQSGFYNEDYGDLQSRIGSEFGNAAKMAALDAAGLSLSGAQSNQSAGLDAARLRYGAGQDAYNNKQNLLSQALQRGQYLDSQHQGNFENDRDFDYGVYGDAADRGRANYENDRNFGRNTFENDRDFGSTRYDDDRDFGYNAYRDDVGDFNNNRDFMEDRFRFDTGQGNNARDFYADWLSGEQDRQTDKDRYKASQPSGFEKAVGVATPIIKTALPLIFPPAAAASVKTGGASANGYDPYDEEDEEYGMAR